MPQRTMGGESDTLRRKKRFVARAGLSTAPCAAKQRRMTSPERLLFAFVCPAALLGTGCAQKQIPAAPPPAAGPALWQVADADTTIYLLGTVHALPEAVEWYKGPIATALGASGEVVTELPRGAVADPTSQQTIMGMAALPPGKNLRDMLSPAQRASYEAALGKLGLPPAAFDRFEPWFAAMRLTMLPLLKNGYTIDSGVEQVVEAKAVAGAERGALETLAFQMAMFDELPPESQIAFLMSTAENIDAVVPTLNAMVEAWRVGDAEKLAALMNAGMTDPVLAERLLYARNQKWAAWIDERLDRPGTVFVAVGAGHLAGARSVQDYLAERGLTAARVQ